MRCARIPAAPGRFRGGLGCEQVVQARHAIRFNSQMDRVKCKPWGLRAGCPALGNWRRASRRFGKAEEQRFPTARRSTRSLHAGDAYILRSGGGGGFGSPLDRDLAALERDVRCGYVSRGGGRDATTARCSRRVSNTIDAAATKARRAEMRAKGLPHDEPIADTGVPPPAPSARPSP